MAGPGQKLLAEWEALPSDSAAPLVEAFLKKTNLKTEEKKEALLLAARVQLKLADYEKAEHFAQKLLSLTSGKDVKHEAFALCLLSKVYQSTHRFSEGQNAMQKALSLFIRSGNQTEAINTQIDLIEFYRAAADPFTGWRLYQNLTPELNAGKLTPNQAARLLHRAAACAAEGSINDSVVALSERSLAISSRYGFHDHMATSYNELGFYYRLKKDFVKALYYLQKAEQLMRDLGHLNELLIVLRNQVIVHTEMGNLDKAGKLLAQLREFPQRPSLYKYSYDYFLLESRLYKARGNYYQAYASLDSARNRQAIFNWQMHNRQIDELTTKYRTALAEQRLLEEKEMASLASKQALRHRFERNTAYLVGGFAIIFAVLLGIAFRTNRKKSRQLEERNQDIDKINKLLSESLLVQESLYSELHHRVKNNLSVLSSLLYLQSNKSDGKVKEALSQTHSRLEALTMLHKQLLSKGQLQEKVVLCSYLQSLFSHLKATFGQPGLTIKENITCQNIQLPATVVTSVGLALNELITNSYKHAFAGEAFGSIGVTCRQDNGKLNVIYYDSGCGLSDNQTATGTSENLGITIINLLVRQHQGSFRYYREGQYSCFELIFLLKPEPTETPIYDEALNY